MVCRVHTRAIQVTAAASYPAEVIAAWSGKLALALYARVIEAGQMFVAEEGGQVVGFGQLNPDNGSIDAVHVDPAVQRRGVGAALLAEAERRARQAGCDVVHAVSSLNAAPFYARGGFSSEGRGEHRMSSGETMACERMWKRLDGRISG